MDKLMIKELRENMMLTQVEFEKLLGISFASVNRYENGKSVPTMKVRRTIHKLMKKYGMSEE